MIVENGKIHLFTKNWIDYTSTHYVINSTLAGSYVATPVDTLNTGYLVTAASKAPGQEVVVLLGGLGNHYIHLLSDYSNGKYFNGNKRKIDLPTALEMGQAEGLTFRNNTYGYISNERLNKTIGPLDINVNQKLRSFNISNFIPLKVLAIDLNQFSVNKFNAADKIVWNFNFPVHNLQIQQSFDGVNFSVLKAYEASTTGSFINKPQSSINYYRIAWRQNDGSYQYSKIISIKNELNNQITHLLLKTNGELSFMLGGSREEYFSFKLLTPDGKELSQVVNYSCKPGYNKINFSSGNINGVVLLTECGSKQKITRLLNVMK